MKKIKLWLNQYASNILPILLLIVDYFAVLLAEKIALVLRINVIPFYSGGLVVPNLYFFVIIPLLFLSCLFQSEVYFRSMPYWEVVKKVFLAVIYSEFLAVMLLYLGGIGETVSRVFVILIGLCAFITICVGRYWLKKCLKNMKIFQSPVIFIGAGKTAELVIRFFDHDTGYGYKIIGFIDDHPTSAVLMSQYKVLCTLERAEKFIRRSGVQHVIFTIPGLEKDRFLSLMSRIQPYVKHISYVPDLIGAPVGNITIEKLFDTNILMLKMVNNLQKWQNRVFKRLFDIVVCVSCLFLIIPVFAIISICICLTSKGGPIYSHMRVGKQGQLFPCFKFRTMVENSDQILEDYLAQNEFARLEWGESFKLKNDPRITNIGKFLRKTSLDELPQIINVILGQMSLVGPRPIVAAEEKYYGIYIKDYYLVPPGITGVWQVNGRSNTTYQERVMMDTWYVRNWSVWIDLIYLFKTVKAVACGKGAY